MAARTRTTEQREQDRAEMAKLLRRGWSKTQIAEKLGVARTQITYDWKVVLKELSRSRDADTAALVDQKLEELAEVKREAWEAWERSKLDAVTRVEDQFPGAPTEEDEAPAPKPGKTRTTITGRLPANEYLQTVLSCIEAERELLALNPAKQVEFSGALDWEALFRRPTLGVTEDPIEAEILGVGPPLVIEHQPPPGTNGCHDTNGHHG